MSASGRSPLAVLAAVLLMAAPAHAQPGGVENVVFKRRSGIAALDDAIEINIRALAPYRRIPSELALDYDVVEVTRLWSIGSGLRLIKTGR